MPRYGERSLLCIICFCLIVSVTSWVGLATEGWGRGKLLRTVDGGKTWTTAVQSYIDLQAVVVPTPFSAVAVGNNCTIIIATPFNHTQISNVSLFNEPFTDAYSGGYLERIGSLNVPAVTVWTTPALRFVYATVHSTSTNQLRSVLFLNASHGVSVGATGTIVRTINSGLDWYPQPSGVIRDLNSLTFMSTSNGDWLMMTCGSVGTILLSNNTGLSWRFPMVGTNTVENLYDVEMITQRQAIACGHAGTVIRSFDGGESWAVITSASEFADYSLYSIAYNGNTGIYYISGSKSLLLESTDSLDSFTVLDLLTDYPQRFSSLFMTPLVQVFGSRARVYTLNNNRTWVKSDYININTISSIVVMEASIMTVNPMIFNLSSYSGFDINFNLTISNVGTEPLIVYSVYTVDELISHEFEGPISLNPGQTSKQINFIYRSSDLIASLATYYTNFTFSCNTPVQTAFVQVSILIVPQPEDMSKSFLSQYWWAIALGFAGLLAILFVFARRRLRYIKRYNRRVMYEDEKISFWGFWLFGAQMDHDSDSDFWSDDEDEDMQDDYDDHQKSDVYEYAEQSELSNSRASQLRRRSVLSSRNVSQHDSEDRSFAEGDEGDEDTDSSISDQDYRDYDYLKHAPPGGKRLAERRSSSFGPYRSAYTTHQRHKSVVQK